MSITLLRMWSSPATIWSLFAINMCIDRDGSSQTYVPIWIGSSPVFRVFIGERYPFVHFPVFVKRSYSYGETFQGTIAFMFGWGGVSDMKPADGFPRMAASHSFLSPKWA